MNRIELKKRLPYLYLLVFLGLSFLIIFLAFAPADQSTAQSGTIVNLILAVFRWFDYVPDANALDTISLLVRKLIGHFGLFMVDGVFGYLTFKGFVTSKRLWLPVLLASGTMLLLASAAELAQLVASGRAGLLSDVILNMAGAMIGVSLMYWIIYRKEARTT